MGARTRRGIRTTPPLISDPPPRVFWVTDRERLERPDFLERAGSVLRSAGGALQLRAHGASGRTLYRTAAALREVAVETGSALWINDRADVAVCVRADGLQLGKRGPPPSVARRIVGRSCRIGFSVHGESEARTAVESGADLLVLGSVYATGSHPGVAPLGPGAIRSAAPLGRPVVAIGGIMPGRVAEVIAAGAWGIAVRSGVWDADDPARAAAEYVAALEAAGPMVTAPGANR